MRRAIRSIVPRATFGMMNFKSPFLHFVLAISVLVSVSPLVAADAKFRLTRDQLEKIKTDPEFQDELDELLQILAQQLSRPNTEQPGQKTVPAFNPPPDLAPAARPEPERCQPASEQERVIQESMKKAQNELRRVLEKTMSPHRGPGSQPPKAKDRHQGFRPLNR